MLSARSLARALGASSVIFFAVAVAVRREWRRREMVVEEIGHDKPKKASDRHQYESDLSKAALRTVEFR